jgi:hypothetical protein
MLPSREKRKVLKISVSITVFGEKNNMGTINFVLNVGNVSDEQITTIKNAIDAQIASWQTNYTAFTFSRDTIQWHE